MDKNTEQVFGGVGVRRPRHFFNFFFEQIGFEQPAHNDWKWKMGIISFEHAREKLL